MRQTDRQTDRQMKINEKKIVIKFSFLFFHGPQLVWTLSHLHEKSFVNKNSLIISLLKILKVFFFILSHQQIFNGVVVYVIV